jgi:DNA-binding HxlR family transcriptional regulator
MSQHPVTSICPRYHHAVELIGKRWNGAIVRILLDGPARFAELAARIPEISDRMLAERLKELEAEHVLVRTVIPETPVRVEYALSDRGRALEPAIRALSEWAENWIPAGAGSR